MRMKTGNKTIKKAWWISLSWFLLLLAADLFAYNLLYHGDAGRPGGLVHMMEACLQGKYIYVADYNKVDVFRKDSSTGVQLIATTNNGCEGYNVAANDQLLVQTCRENGLKVFTLANPENPTFSQEIVDPVASFEEPVFVGQRLYIASHKGGVFIYDMEANLQLTKMGQFTGAPDASGIAILNDYLLVADGQDGLIVVDIAFPTQPVKIKSIRTPGQAQEVRIDGKYAYVAMGAAGVSVYDLTDIENPQWISTYNTTSLAVHIEVSNQKVFVADWDDMEVIDFSDKKNPKLVGLKRTKGSAMGLLVEGDFIYLTDWSELGIYEWSEILGPDIYTNTSNLQFPRTAVGNNSKLELEILNHGSEILTISNIQAPAEYTVDKQTASIAPGSNIKITVTYTPASNNSPRSNLRIQSNDSDEPVLPVTLYGNAANRLMIGDPAPEVDLPYANLPGRFQLSAALGKTVYLEFFAFW